MKRRLWSVVPVAMLSLFVAGLAFSQEAVVEAPAWPPQLDGAKNGTVTLTTDVFLKVPDAVAEAAKKEGAASFIVAEEPPTVDLAFHAPLPNPAFNGTGWSAWGDIGVASDGRVYSGTGDHGDDAGGNSYCFIHQWDPRTKVLKQVVEVNEVVPRQPGQPTWSKVHARIDEGADGKIYFSATLNDGQRAKEDRYHWTEQLPGGQLYQYDPATGKTVVVANLPPERCTGTSLLDRKRNIWWCNLEAGPHVAQEGDHLALAGRDLVLHRGRANGLYALDLTTREVVYQDPGGEVGLNGNFALANDGSIYFNGKDDIWKYDPQKKDIAPIGKALPGSSGMRSSTRESTDGHIYGNSMDTNQLFRFTPATHEFKQLGHEFLSGNYTTVCVLSPDERFLYYMPGAHGGARDIGTPVLQYEIATGQRKVIAFMREAFEKLHSYVPSGSYGVKMSADGSTLYVNFNGSHVPVPQRHQLAFGLTSFAAIHIPESER